MRVDNDVLGRPYWSLNRGQQALALTLGNDWVRLRLLLDQAGKEGGSNHPNQDWQKLCVMQYMVVRRSAEGWVQAKRGRLWREFDRRFGGSAMANRLEFMRTVAALSELDVGEVNGKSSVRGRLLIEKMKHRERVTRLERKLLREQK